MLDLAKIVLALETANAGPWSWGGPAGKYMVYSDGGLVIADVHSGVHDAQLIAHAREWVGQLVARVRELERREREWIPAVVEKAQAIETCSREFVPELLGKLRALERALNGST